MDWMEVAESIRRGIWDLQSWADLASDQEEEWGNPEGLDGLCPSRAGVEITREEVIPNLERALAYLCSKLDITQQQPID